jgi:hypothetical protein
MTLWKHPLRHERGNAPERSTLDHLEIQGHERQALASGKPDVDSIGGTKPRQPDDTSHSAYGSGTEGDDDARDEVLVEEPADARGGNAAANERRDHLDVEDRRDDHLVLSGEQGHAVSKRRSMAWLARSQGCDRDRGVENVPHRRPARRSWTAETAGSAALNSATKASTLRRAASASIAFLAAGGFGVATSTGTMAAAGFPWRRISVRFPWCSAWSTSSEMCALASASDIFFMVTNMTQTRAGRQRRSLPTSSSVRCIMIVSSFQALSDPRATRHETTWVKFCRWHDRPKVHDGDKSDLPLTAPVAFRDDYRSKDDAEVIYLLTFDVDVEPRCAPGVLADLLRGTEANVSTSFRHTEDAPRCRLYLLPSRPLAGPSEYAIVWRFAADIMRARGVGIGAEASDASRASFVPAHRPCAPYEHHVISGAPLSVDAILEAERARRAREEAMREGSGVRRLPLEYPDDDSDAATLERAVQRVRETRSGRHSELNRWAWILGRFTLLPDDAIEDALQPAGEATGLSAREAERTIRGALRSARRVA